MSIAMRKIFMAAFLFTLGQSVSGQSRPATGLWTAAALHLNFSSKWQWNNDAGYRTLGMSTHPIQYLYRSGIRYNFNENWNIATGVAFFFTKTDFDKSHHEFGNEFRIWQEGTYQSDKASALKFLLRLRTEQRFFASTSIKNNYTAYRFRLRPGINQRLNDKWSLQLTEEYMRQLANHKFSFDQNRIAISAICHFNANSQLQAGYIWIDWPTSDQHIFTFAFTKTISVHGS